MKKLVLLAAIIISALFITSCHTNVIEVDGSGGGGNNGGDIIEHKKDLVFGDPAQLNQQVFAESQVCQLKFTSANGWDVMIDDFEARKWVSVSINSSNVGGTFTLSIIVGENSTGRDRTAVLQLLSGAQKERITIHQQPSHKDGTRPGQYEPDAFTDVVDKIVVQSYTSGNSAPQISEWRFDITPEESRVESMELYQISSGVQSLREQIVMYGQHEIVRTVYGASSNGVENPTHRTKSETIRNDYNFIISQTIRELDLLSNSNPEPTVRQRNHLYSNYRRTAERGDNNDVNEYQWANGNMVGQSLGISSSNVGFTYGTEPNDRANIDLNTFLTGDMYAAVGLLGKRSQNLMTSTSADKGRESNFSYTFDVDGRVVTVTCRRSLNGTSEPARTVYHVYYMSNNI